jgi:hypothetical protein
MDLLTSPYLAFWYEIPTGGVTVGISTSWAVADGTGQTVGGVHLSGKGVGRPISYSVVDMAGTQLVGYAEPGFRESRKDPSLKVLGPDGSQVGSMKGHDVFWDGAAVAKLSIKVTDDERGLEGAWMWDVSDNVIATVALSKEEVGSCLTLSRPEGLAEPLPAATLALPLATHQYLFRRDQRTMERRGDRRERGQMVAGTPGRIL